MNIINQSRELTKMEIYKLTEGKKTISVKDAVGLTFRVNAWCEYEDQNEKGDKSHVLSILATDGCVYTTVSEVFRRTKSSSGLCDTHVVPQLWHQTK